MRGAREGAIKRDEITRIEGAQRAAYVANGLDLTSGSSTDVMTDTAKEGNMEVAQIIWDGNRRADNENEQAKLSRSKKVSGAAMALGFVSPVIKAIA